MLGFHRSEQGFDTLGFLIGFVEGKFNGWHEAQVQLLADFRTDKSSGALEPRQRVTFVDAGAEEIEKDFSLPQIFGDPNCGQIYRLEPRIADLSLQELGEQFQQQVTDT